MVAPLPPPYYKTLDHLKSAKEALQRPMEISAQITDAINSAEFFIAQAKTALLIEQKRGQ